MIAGKSTWKRGATAVIVIVAALGAVGSFLGVIVDVLPAIDLLEKWFGQELSANVIGAICSAAAGDIIIAIKLKAAWIQNNLCWS